MKMKEHSITVSRTFNLGNFESLRIEAGMSASIDDGEEEQAREKILIEIKKSLAAAYRANAPKRGDS